MKASDADRPADGYVLPRTSGEYERLRKQSEIWDEATRRVLEKIGIGPGMSCLDVGCGPGGVMALMAERVGPTGRVTGFDSDAALGAEVLTHLKASGPDIYRYVSGDVTRTDSVPAAPFDLVFARLLMFHLPDSVSALRRLMGWVKPGGVLCIMDYDTRAVTAHCNSAAPGRVSELFDQAFIDSGKHPHIGSEMPYLFQQAFGHWPDGVDYSGHMMSIVDAAANDLGPLLNSMRDVIRDRLGCSESEIDELSSELARLAATNAPGCFAMPAMIATWARKSL